MEEWAWLYDCPRSDSLFYMLTGFRLGETFESEEKKKDAGLNKDVEISLRESERLSSRELRLYRIPSDIKGVYHELPLFPTHGQWEYISWYVGLDNCEFDEKLSILLPETKDVVDGVGNILFDWEDVVCSFFQLEILVKYPGEKWNIMERCFTSKSYWVHSMGGRNSYPWYREGRRRNNNQSDKAERTRYAWRVRAVEKSGKIGKWTNFVDFEGIY
jgi:hypothetical protein